MKVYFAGPLFTPYERQFISEHAQLLRQNGIEVFVPHEQNIVITQPVKLTEIIEKGLVTREELDGENEQATITKMLRTGRLSREQVGLPPMSAAEIFEVDYGGLSSSNAFLALLDGAQVDDGTACEIGIFYSLIRQDPAHKKGILGFMTDARALRKKEQGFGVNLFVLGVIEECGKLYDNFEDLLTQLKTWNAE